MASQADVSPIEEPIFIITSGQLEAIILQAIEQATAPLEARLQDLQDRIDALEVERGVGCRVGGEEALPDLRGRLENLEELRPWMEALSKKVNRLESRPGMEGPKAEEHIEELCRIMRKDKLPSLSFANAAKFLGISKGRIKQLKPQIAKDGRFDILHAPGQKKKLIITLRKHGVKNG